MPAGLHDRTIDMKLSQVIFYISLCIWLLPPLKQFRGKFFYYFLFQAISDPISLLLMKFHFYNLPFYVIKEILIILCFWNPKEALRKAYFIVPAMGLIYYFIYYSHYNIMRFVIAVLHTAVLYFIFRKATDDIMDLKKIKVFYILIILYELSVILKYIMAISSVNLGTVYFSLTSAFEILLGVFFIFVSERNEKFAIPIPERNKVAA